MSRKREIATISLSMLDLLSGALGAMMILYIAVPKAKQNLIEQSTISPHTTSSKQSPKEVVPAHLGFKFKGKKLFSFSTPAAVWKKRSAWARSRPALNFS